MNLSACSIRGKGILAVLILASLSGYAVADITVIANPSVTATVSSKDVERIFLGKSSAFSDGSVAVPINSKDGNQARGEFDQTVLGRSTAQVSAFWSKQIFTGKGMPPKEVSSDEEMVQTVSTTPGAIGYVDSSAVNDSVKVLVLN